MTDIRAPAAALDNLPAEILYAIFDYLHPDVLFYTVKLVCKRFAQLLSREEYFKLRFIRKYLTDDADFPLLKYYGLDDTSKWRSGVDISWTDVAVRFSVREHVWGHQHVRHRVFSGPHTATVDTVHLLNYGELCVSGGRDKLLCLWNVFENESHAQPIDVVGNAHDSWLWDIAAHEQDNFFSCGWDTAINHWTLTESQIVNIQSFCTEQGAMRISSVPGLVVGGAHSGRIVLIDPRIGYSRLSYHKCHRGTITGIQIWNDQIFTIGEDRKMSAFDLRNQKTVIHQHINCVLKTCPRSIGVYNNLLYIGDSKGYLSIFDIKSDYKPVLCTHVGKNRGINTLIPCVEGVVIGTSDVGLRFIVPSFPTHIFADYDLGGEVTSIDMVKNTLVAGTSNSCSCVHIMKGCYNRF